MKIETIDCGDQVLCDMCNKDYTHSILSGGYLFGSNGVCPACAPGMMENIKRHGEEDYIRGHCPKDMSFADWIRKIRGGPAVTTIYSGTSEEIFKKVFDRLPSREK
ncbi:MAG: hypothetical protein ACR2QH_15210 [Geminicoccaceae bacterium]